LAQILQTHGDRFAITSVCDNIRAFHSLKQTSTVAAYIQQFEAAMNLLRRDNPSLPDNYYISSFISGLHEYIQAHLQYHKPADLQQAMWLARRMETAVPQKKTYTTPQYPVRRQVQFEQKPANSTTAAVIQEAKLQNICYKCNEPWFPVHKKVCTMATKNQVLSLQAVHDDKKNVIFITENSDSEDEQEEAQPELQLSMHALCGMRSAADTFTVSIQVGKHYATALVDTGSTTTLMTPQFAT
jgi:hypothetical protein